MSAKLFSARRPAVEIRGVHLDLKGVPPTPKRLLKLLDLFSALRINAVLAEWEDTFPWSRYPELKSPTAYTPAEIKSFADRAADLGIEIIPLVQCLGHAENVLSKKRFAALCEVKDNVAQFCPSNPASARVVIDMVDDVMHLLGGRIRRFHLGGDEARYMGSCPRCRRAVGKIGKGGLYLNHVGPILDHLNDWGVKPILWDDMMRPWPDSALRKLGRRADLMSWSYAADPAPKKNKWLNPGHLRRFRRDGIRVWGASAYKGGDGAWMDVPDTKARAQNNLAWARLACENGLAGVVATAWSRYDTFMAPCETIDSSLHTLVIAAAAMWDGNLPRDYMAAAQSFLRRHPAEFKRFRNCFQAASNLGRWQKGSILWHLEEAERAAHLSGEPDRINPGIVRRHIEGIKKEIAKGRALGAAFIRAHRGAIPDRWLRLYVASRVNPFVRRFKSLSPACACRHC